MGRWWPRRVGALAIMVWALFSALVPQSPSRAIAGPPEGRILVALREPSRLRSLHADLRPLDESRSGRFHVYAAPAGREAEIAATLRRNPAVRIAEPDFRIEAHVGSDDNGYSQQWAPQKIGAPIAWDLTTGASSIVLAILDSGVDRSHPEFAGRLLPGKSFVAGVESSNDDNGHGSHVAGIAAATGNNGVGIAGIAWGVQILPVKILAGDGSGYVSSLIDGLDYAREQGAKIVNISLGAGQTSDLLQEAIDRAVAAGMLIVAAAGNSGVGQNEPSYPAASPGVMAVAATDSGDRRSIFSTSGGYVSVAAPGSGIYSTSKAGGYAIKSGTSMASPHVAGFAALIWSRDPSLTASAVRKAIEESAIDVGAPGRDNEYGYGRIDAERWASQMTKASPSVPSPPSRPVNGGPIISRVYLPLGRG